ncbi:MAG TPA: hypothetical protein PLJ78_02185 [Anaerolineae bacterium]|nr:hypothetical protein [Anaerolineae bacterium]HQK12734.1 hypothetical protein [Anaerolineae bacterium]
MKQGRFQRKILPLIFVLVLIAVSGCRQSTAAETTSATAEAAVYTGALRTDYENALDVTGQLALGILRLEGTENAVTAEQAAQLLPLWKTLQGSTVTTQAERYAVIKQIEALLTSAQIGAITAMQLTEADAQAWFQEQGPAMIAPGGQMPAGGMGFSGQGNVPTMSEEERAAMRERFQNMTEEQLAQLQAQFRQGGGRPTGDGNAWGGSAGAPTGAGSGAASRVSGLLTLAVVNLLTERSGETPGTAVPSAEPRATTAITPTATASATPTATPTPIARVTLVPWRTREAQGTSTPTPSTSTSSATNDTSPVVATASTQPTPQAATAAQATTVIQNALTQKPDTDPGPPLTVEVTTNYAEPNPLLEGGLIYKVAGFIHNPTDATYAVTAVHVTFFDAGGFRGAFYAFPMRPGQRGIQGEWIWHGAMEAETSCGLLGPGESCPFTAEIAGQDMASFLVHPDAEVAEWHEAVSVTLRDIKVADTGTNYLRINGVATNPNPYPIKNIVISGLLLDDHGQMVSMGTGAVPSIVAGGSASFEIYIEKKAYASYQLHARAEQDAK